VDDVRIGNQLLVMLHPDLDKSHKGRPPDRPYTPSRQLGVDFYIGVIE